MNRDGAVIAVTGSSGFVGRQFCVMAMRAGYGIRPVPRTALRSPDLPELLRGTDALVHLAARAHDRPEPSSALATALHDDNVRLVELVGDACVAASVARLVFVSSAGVLGRSSPPGGFTDASPPAPHDAYTRSKLAAEHLLRKRYADGLDTVIIRPPLVYGPGATGTFARFMSAATSHWPLPFGTLTAPRSVLGVRNLCDLLLRSITSAEARGHCLLAADRETTSIADMIRQIRAAQQRPARLFGVPQALLTGTMRLAGRQRDLAALQAPFELRPSIASDTLEWTPPYRLQDEIVWTVRSEIVRSGVT